MSFFDNIKNKFGLSINSKNPDKSNPSKILAADEDGGLIVDSVGPAFSSRVFNSDYLYDDESNLIKKYRDMSLNVDCDRAIQNIVNELVNITDDNQMPVSINLDKIDDIILDPALKEDIVNEFNNILNLINFKNNAANIVRDWYIDGRLFFQKIVDKSNLKKGLIDLRRIDALDIRKVKQVEREVDPETGAVIIEKEVTYFLYSPNGDQAGFAGQSLLLSQDAVAYCHSGLYCYKEEPSNKNLRNTAGAMNNKFIVSYLHPAIKPLNQLSILEDATIIYRISRSSEKLIHYIDVSGLPKAKAESAMKEYVQEFRNKTNYNSVTGAVDTDSRAISLQENIFIPRRNGSNTAEISTLAAGQNLGEIEDVFYFQKKLYKSLKVPLSRLNDEAGSFLGRSSEINRDELNFSKHINQLRSNFNTMWLDLLKTQLILKNIITLALWNKIYKQINFDYLSSTYITDLRNLEMLSEKISVLDRIDNYVGEGKYFSKNYVNKTVLGLTEEQVTQIEDENKAEPVANPDNPNNEFGNNPDEISTESDEQVIL